MAPRRGAKPKFLLDEGLPRKSSFPTLNEYCSVKHINHDYHLSGAKDRQVYELALRDGRLLVTLNTKDFTPLLSENRPSIISLTPNISNTKADQKILSLAKRLRESEFLGQHFTITS
ncbi:MAG: DUF5615 family PIN-like protein [Candidatus Berkelbacteria bacterium]|nr:DUF5615 family PIN-like protein [Candidatus Berkelbacteria bacterium]MCR4308256.1 DUF5615 family PIN-like protein [Candidatus Berkelbacteria bacterium]